jgi:MOSC domain-containing protein YiiM
MKANIKSIAIGDIIKYGECGNIFESAYKKDQFFNYVEINDLGIVGDKQSDKKHHGGIDKAIHIGSYKHFENYESTFETPLDKLSIGCNILVDTLDESDVCVGDIYSIGEVIVQVTQPRQPCWKIGTLFGKEISRYIIKNSATGWYVKVLQEGSIDSSDTMKLEQRESEFSIKELSYFLHKPPCHKEIIDQVISTKTLAKSYKSYW